MLTLLLALSAQTAALSADTGEAALTCGAALRKSATTMSTEISVPAMYLSMLATSVQKSDGTFADRLRANSGDMYRRSQAMTGDPKPVIAECRKRFPKAFAQTATLPGDAYERGAMCTFVSGSYFGLASESARVSGDDSEKKRVEGRVPFYADLISDADYNAHGIRTANDIPREFGRVLTASLEHGNVRAIFQACEAAYPG
ncbi:hypothetical protein P1X14_04535 [Sphingomonas sp. AOB5]|uniref:hypothetical protein n=1 Tax=Sphingomonas sp. AOB5 TaxID=3034017 RepID=UPI0023F88832|nr:hypothetical protein [Sphingomonas sp. AOB5]MDF7774503.1 hypothetical protein [Sphingomonas sp. AOB5]